jgi:hypothetical protein
MQILEEHPGRIHRFDKFEETWYERMQGLGIICIRSVHVHGLGGIKFLRMEILEENLRKIRWFGTFEVTIHVGIQGLGRISIRSGHACGVGGIGI